MRTLRVSTTDLDAYRRFRDDDDEDDMALLLARIRRQIDPTESMLAGTALHTALENAVPGDYASLSADGYTFRLEIDGEIDLPPIREIKGAADYLIGDCLTTLVGKVDVVFGRRVDDHKFTANYDAERFLGSYQWRIYLEMFGADEFRWNVFEGRETEPKCYVVRNLHVLRQHRYPGMGEDVLAQLTEFVGFASEHLPERFAPMGAP